jgi:hypothetical protein
MLRITRLICLCYGTKTSIIRTKQLDCNQVRVIKVISFSQYPVPNLVVASRQLPSSEKYSTKEIKDCVQILQLLEQSVLPIRKVHVWRNEG